jgi:hypothetical protein
MAQGFFPRPSISAIYPADESWDPALFSGRVNTRLLRNFNVYELENSIAVGITDERKMERTMIDTML